MKARTLKLAATLIIPTVMLGLSGCKTAPVNPLASQNSPALVGGFPVLEKTTKKGVISSVTPAQRAVALQSKKGVVVSAKAAPELANYAELQPGQKVKVTLTDLTAIFPAKNGPPPNAGAGVQLAGQPAVVLQTKDANAKVRKVDPSYRLMTLEFADGSKKEYKIALPATLANVQKGDEMVVRTTEPLVICAKPK